MRTDSNPTGRLLEQFTAEAFEAHPYHRPTVGWMADLNSFSASDARKFFDEYYVPANMVVAVVGDVKTSEAMPILEKYFSRLPNRPKPDETTTTEPPQNSERRVELKEQTQPLYLEGYHRPDYRSQDDAVYDAHHRPYVGRAHFPPVSRSGPRQENRRVFRRFQRPARHKVSTPVRLLRLPAARTHHAGSGDCDSRRDRPPEKGRHRRRRTEDDQDPFQGQPDPRARR